MFATLTICLLTPPRPVNCISFVFYHFILIKKRSIVLPVLTKGGERKEEGGGEGEERKARFQPSIENILRIKISVVAGDAYPHCAIVNPSSQVILFFTAAFQASFIVNKRIHDPRKLTTSPTAGQGKAPTKNRTKL